MLFGASPEIAVANTVHGQTHGQNGPTYRTVVDTQQRLLYAHNMVSGEHSKKEVREALAYAKSLGWTIHPGGSHRWGIIWCPAHEHHVTIHSTPKNAGNHGNQIRRVIDRDHCEPKPKEA